MFRSWTPPRTRRNRPGGLVHLNTVPVALVVGIILITVAEGTASTTRATVFTATSLLLFGVSAANDRISWSPRAKAVFRSLDRASICLLIVGTYTPGSLCRLRTPAHSDEKETMMIKRHPYVGREIIAHDPDTVENHVDAAVPIVREQAIVARHGYTS